MPSPLQIDPETHGRLGTEIYEQLRPMLERSDFGRVVAIDVDSGAYEVADETIEAATRLRDRYPEAPIWFVRVGQGAVHRLGIATAGAMR